MILQTEEMNDKLAIEKSDIIKLMRQPLAYKTEYHIKTDQLF